MPDDTLDPEILGQFPGDTQAGRRAPDSSPEPAPGPQAAAPPPSGRARSRPRKGPAAGGGPGGRSGPAPTQVAGERPSEAGADARARARSQQDLLLDDDEELLDHTEAQWEAAGTELCAVFIEHVGKDYLAILNEFMDYADAATDNYRRLSSTSEKWRKWTIVATGGLAAVNSLAAFDLVGRFTIPEPNNKITVPAILSAIAAVYAVALTVVGNLESFFNAGEKAAGFRESRELFITTYRAYVWRWKVSVEAFGVSGKACVNAARLYGRLIRTDRELRVKVKELTETQGSRGPAAKDTG
jgi:hypothetical protein